ncbi:hypothetical protein GYMLUDRAFT_78264 [Collybiopsis luxurians FD-317 M1]|uniref:Xylanolytic transcriptional activator regulatory domain-containing protein n=1 Tax=Collybiopsis luxurians FD-317 M1 TaxID=944289 RepID=A0A0D0BAF5_9AGAR|nr:hypothetical protein GYMLUDRAFT_78264 [Collybiopsis luxurians FD-317 M1]
MSDEEQLEDKILRKKRRLQGACDECRKRKSDSSNRPGNVCSSCLAFGTECTHFFTKKKRGPPRGTPRGQKTIPSIVKLIVSTKETYEPPSDSTAVKQLLIEIAGHAQSLEEENTRLRHQILQLQRSAPSNFTVLTPSEGSPDGSGGSTALQVPPGSYLDIDAHAIDGLNEHMKKLEIHSASDRFFGGSSSLMLLKTAIDIKNEYTGESPEDSALLDSFDFTPRSAPAGNRDTSARDRNCKRPEFWTIHPWQIIPVDDPPPLIFPENDLLQSLISLYFSNINVYYPILHKPTFVRSISENLHLEDRRFGALVLAVCAVGARFSDDARVYEDGLLGSKEENRGNAKVEQSVGWKWIRQIQLVKKSFTEPPSIYEIQLYGVYVLFMQATTTPEACWIIVSIGVRFAQDVGAHRRKQSDSEKPTIENELWKRVFWMLYTMDIFTSAFLGRPRSIAVEDFDIDFPADVDDEYWEKDFQQPAGKPSIRAYVVSLIKLMDVLGYAMRTIYAIRRSDIWTARGMSGIEWNEKIVSELDSSLNRWVDEIPEHLRWDPHREDPVHFHQSVMLYTTYYWIQILIHRPFIARPGDGSGSVLSFPSLAICANAARSCCHVVDVQRRRNLGALMMPNVTMALFMTSIVLLVNVWRGRRLRVATAETDIEKELADVYRCINLLSLQEKRWQHAGRYCDILREIILVSHFHHSMWLPSDASGLLSTKRSHEIALESIDENDNSENADGSVSAFHGDRPMAGSHRVSAVLAAGQASTSSSQTSNTWMQFLQSSKDPDFFHLPTRSKELGNLPIYESFTDNNLLSDAAATSSFDFSLQQTEQIPISTDAPNQPQSFFNDISGIGLTSPPGLTFGHINALYPAGNFLGEFVNMAESQNLDLNLPDAPNMTRDLDDWASYMATVDEILHNVNPRA